MPVLRRSHLWPARWAEILQDRDTLRTVAEGQAGDAEADWGPAWSTFEERARCLQRWLRTGAWSYCHSCRSMSMQTLDARAFADEIGCATISRATCVSPYVAPQRLDFPRPLQGLEDGDAFLLRPFNVHLGAYNPGHPQGYRRHTAPLRLSWKPLSVADAIAATEPARRRRLQCAFEYLMDSKTSSYRTYIGRHNAWLNGGEENERRLPFTILLELYLECALWPDLYPSDAFCDSRWSAGDAKMRSPKAAFLTKCLSAVADYSSSFELLQFQYDRWILTKFLGRAQAVRPAQLELKYAMADLSETPYCCYLNHMRLIDMHRQLGPASYFITLAPGVFSTQWHAWVAHQAALTGKALLGNAVVEVLHLLHGLRQIVTKYLLQGSRSPFWVPSQKKTCVRAWLYRVEFQEGTRKSGPNAARPDVPQRDGTGVPHIHLLVWTDGMDHLSHLASELSAELPTDNSRLAAAVRRQQCSHESRLPVQAASTHWQLQAAGAQQMWQLCIQHSQASKDSNVRPYFTALSLARVCHQDVQVVRNAADVMRYTAAYVRYSTKASSAMNPTMLLKGTSGVQAAFAMLKHLMPSAAQMVAALHTQALCSFSCFTKEVHLPSIATARLHAAFQKYLLCPDRADSLCFVDWLRQYRDDLEVPRRYKQTKGFGCAVGLLYASRLSDFFCGQWLCAWRPWRTQPTLPEACLALPAEFQNFHACRLLAPEYWQDLRGLRADLQLEGHAPQFVAAVLAHYRAAAEVCDLILAGQLEWAEARGKDMAHDLSHEQVTFYRAVLSDLAAVESSAEEACVARALLGVPGTGKSRVLAALVTATWQSARPPECWRKSIGSSSWTRSG